MSDVRNKNSAVKMAKDIAVVGLITISLCVVMMVVVETPFSEVVHVEASSVKYPELNQSVFINLGRKSGSGVGWYYDEALPTSITMYEDDVYYFYVEWYIYAVNADGTDSITFLLESDEYVITRGLIVGNNGTLEFLLINECLRVTFTMRTLNVLGDPLGVI